MTQVQAPTYTYARESLTAALWAELDPMFADHWRECAPLTERNPDVPLMLQMEAAHLTRWFLVREGSRCIGYIAFMVMHSPKSRHSLQAVCDRFYVDPLHRGEVSRDLLRFAEAQLLAEGVEVISVNVKPTTGARALMVWAGYEQSEIVYAKRLRA